MNQRLIKVASILAILTVGGAALAVTLTQRVRQKNLVSSPDFSPPAANTDRNLVNSWGLVFVNDLLLVANNGTGTSTFYDEDGNPFPRNYPTVINVNGHNTRNADPTGLALNPDGGFRVSKGRVTRAATLVYANEDGTIAAWNRDVDPNDALVVVDTNDPHHPKDQAVYKGLTFAIDAARQPFLFVADFGAPGVNDGTGKVDVYNRNFVKVAEINPDVSRLPRLPDDEVFTPFNVMNVDNLLFVTLAVKIKGDTDEQHCDDCGAVQVFTTTGRLLQTITSPASGEHIFNAPWGVSLAPFVFGKFNNQILIGNFGDGTINAFSRTFPFRFLGRITDQQNKQLVIEGLWGIDRGKTFGQIDDLFFASGPAQGGEEESKGLVGELDPLP